MVLDLSGEKPELHGVRRMIWRGIFNSCSSGVWQAAIQLPIDWAVSSDSGKLNLIACGSVVGKLTDLRS